MISPMRSPYFFTSTFFLRSLIRLASVCFAAKEWRGGRNREYPPLRTILPHFKVGLDFYCVGVADLCKRVHYFTIFNDHTATDDLKVSFFSVYDNVEVFITSVFFAEQSFKTSSTTFIKVGRSIFSILKFLECLY